MFLWLLACSLLHFLNLQINKCIISPYPLPSPSIKHILLLTWNHFNMSSECELWLDREKNTVASKNRRWQLLFLISWKDILKYILPRLWPVPWWTVPKRWLYKVRMQQVKINFVFPKPKKERQKPNERKRNKQKKKEWKEGYNFNYGWDRWVEQVGLVVGGINGSISHAVCMNVVLHFVMPCFSCWIISNVCFAVFRSQSCHYQRACSIY